MSGTRARGRTVVDADVAERVMRVVDVERRPDRARRQLQRLSVQVCECSVSRISKRVETASRTHSTAGSRGTSRATPARLRRSRPRRQRRCPCSTSSALWVSVCQFLAARVAKQMGRTLEVVGESEYDRDASSIDAARAIVVSCSAQPRSREDESLCSVGFGCGEDRVGVDSGDGLLPRDRSATRTRASEGAGTNRVVRQLESVPLLRSREAELVKGRFDAATSPEGQRVSERFVNRERRKGRTARPRCPPDSTAPPCLRTRLRRAHLPSSSTC